MAEQSDSLIHLPTSAETSDLVRMDRSSLTAVTARMKAASWAPDSVSNRAAGNRESRLLGGDKRTKGKAYLVLLSPAESCILGLG